MSFYFSITSTFAPPAGKIVVDKQHTFHACYRCWQPSMNVAIISISAAYGHGVRHFEAGVTIFSLRLECPYFVSIKLCIVCLLYKYFRFDRIIKRRRKEYSFC